MCGLFGLNGICSAVSPGKGYVNTGICGYPESWVESEECQCWVNLWAEPYPGEPLDANP